jgi:hypothetical protein
MVVQAMYTNAVPDRAKCRTLRALSLKEERKMRSSLTVCERALLVVCLALVAFALFGPAARQPAHYHEFADQRVLLGVPFAMDVFSNLAFLAVGLAGGACLIAYPARALTNVGRAMSILFVAGLLFTAIASAWYHLRPDDAGLAIDRGGMAIAFAGVLGLSVAGRISDRAGAAMGIAMLLATPLALECWRASGNILPWGVLQFGGMGLVFCASLLRPRAKALDVRWGLVILAYAAAKLFELNDEAVFQLTAHLVSGHTLKHLFAALAGCPVVAALWALRNSRQNAASKARAIDRAYREAGTVHASSERSPV